MEDVTSALQTTKVFWTLQGKCLTTRTLNILNFSCPDFKISLLLTVGQGNGLKKSKNRDQCKNHRSKLMSDQVATLKVRKTKSLLFLIVDARKPIHQQFSFSYHIYVYESQICTYSSFSGKKKATISELLPPNPIV